MRRILFIVTLIVVSVPIFAQNIDVGVGYGASYFTAPDKYVQSVYRLGYGFTQSNPFLVTIFYSIPNRSISLFSSLVYQKLSGRGFLPLSFIDNANLLPGEVQNNSSLWSFSLGTELKFINKRGSPFLSVEILLSQMDNISIIQGSPSGDIYKQASGSIRSGFAVGGGLHLPIVVGITLKIMGKYNQYGLFSRPADEKSINSVQLLGMVTFPLYSISTEQK